MILQYVNSTLEIKLFRNKIIFDKFESMQLQNIKKMKALVGGYTGGTFRMTNMGALVGGYTVGTLG